MNHDPQTAIDQDFAAFARETHPTEPPLDLEPEVAEYLELAREVAFRTGWDRGRAWEADRLGDAPTVRCTPRATVRALCNVGDRAWTQPLAIIEHIPTGDRFVDPRFPISLRPADDRCVELRMTEDGLVAVGPTDQHRLSHEVDRARLRPLVELHPTPPVAAE